MTNRTEKAQKFNAGRATALADAKRGAHHPTRKGDNADWSAGYKAAAIELAATHGPDWLAKISEAANLEYKAAMARILAA